MAMDASAMAAEVITQLKDAGLIQNPDPLWWTAICQGIINHIKSNMDVLPATHGSLALTNPAGQSGIITAGVASGDPTVTNAPQVITGTGSAQ